MTTESYLGNVRLLVPEWDDIIVRADSEDEARMLIKEEAEASWPEASSIEILKVEMNA